MICERTGKEKFRYDRMHQILVSAMIQSQQVWLPELENVKSINEVIIEAGQDQKFIAHCEPSEKRSLGDLVNENLRSQIILIGPEGDFTKEEIETAATHHFTGVTLGETRLRTETAGIVAAVLLVQG
jgi:16S rRNA (uracil1498-N3)-methyltransferase